MHCICTTQMQCVCSASLSMGVHMAALPLQFSSSARLPAGSYAKGPHQHPIYWLRAQGGLSQGAQCLHLFPVVIFSFQTSAALPRGLAYGAAVLAAQFKKLLLLLMIIQHLLMIHQLWVVSEPSLWRSSLLPLMLGAGCLRGAAREPGSGAQGGRSLRGQLVCRERECRSLLTCSSALQLTLSVTSC